jgi:hypothetical protein
MKVEQAKFYTGTVEQPMYQKSVVAELEHKDWRGVTAKIFSCCRSVIPGGLMHIGCFCGHSREAQ